MALLIVGLNGSNAFSMENDEIYDYIELASGMSLRLDAKKMEIIMGRHSVVDARNCADKPQYKCIIGGGGYFIFPINKISEDMMWEYEGKYFRVTRKINRQIFGKKYITYVIRRKEGDDNYWYLFSQENGLLAFGEMDRSAISTFVLQGKCGFASSSRCKN